MRTEEIFWGEQWRWERPGEEEEPAWKGGGETVVGVSWGQRAGSGSLQPHPPHSPCSSQRVALKHKCDHLLLGQEPPRGIPFPWGEV